MIINNSRRYMIRDTIRGPDILLNNSSSSFKRTPLTVHLFINVRLHFFFLSMYFFLFIKNYPLVRSPVYKMKSLYLWSPHYEYYLELRVTIKKSFLLL